MAADGQPVLIEIAGLTKRFGSFTAVDGVSFSVARGEVLGFLGPNGAGKSTTMRMLAGFMIPSAGAARICGHDVQDDGVKARRVLGFLPEGAPTYPEMTVSGFLNFCAKVRGYSGPDLKERGCLSKVLQIVKDGKRQGWRQSAVARKRKAAGASSAMAS